jgi:hypothetical protein
VSAAPWVAAYAAALIVWLIVLAAGRQPTLWKGRALLYLNGGIIAVLVVVMLARQQRPGLGLYVLARFGGCRKECLGALAHRSAGDQPDSGEMLRTNANTVRQNRAGLHGARRRRDAGVSSPNADDAHSTLHRNQQLKKRSTDPRPDRQTVPSVVPNAENPHLNHRFPPTASRFPLPALRNPTYPRGQVHDLTSKP